MWSKKNVSAVALGGLTMLIGLSAPSSAQECRRIRNPTDRLKCYDAKEELSKPASGPWERVNIVDFKTYKRDLFGKSVELEGISYRSGKGPF